MKKIAIIYNLVDYSSSNEEEKLADKDTYESAKLVLQSLHRQKYDAKLYGITPSEVIKVKNIAADLFFNMCEWTGNKSHLAIEVVRLLESMHAKYTGGNLENQIWGSDKILMKYAMTNVGLTTPKWTIDKFNSVTFPAIVKTSREHCSIGLNDKSIVQDMQSLKKQVEEMQSKFSQPIIVEEFIPGNEYQAFVIGRSNGPLVLPLYETIYRAKTADDLVLMTFNDNWLSDDTNNKIKSIGVAKDTDLTKQMIEISKKAFIDLKCVGYVRLDFRIKDGKPYVLEINVNPGLGWDEDEDVTVSAKAAGLNFDQLIKLIMDAPKHVSPTTQISC